MIRLFIHIFERMTIRRVERYGITVLLAFSMTSCGLLKKAPDGSSPENAILLDTIDLEISTQALLPYQPAPDILINIHHVELDLRFDWAEETVIGRADVDLSAYFQPVDTVFLDAQGFEIKELLISQGDSMVPADYTYDKEQLAILLNSPLTSEDTMTVSVQYHAFPSKIEVVAGRAIESNQGLYFINPDGAEEDKPRQIWTQGETENNSTWFPSVDHPHEKFTQEIYLTVDSAYHTVSNGRLVASYLNADGTRTDYWRQELPHSNYLVMLAIGEFALVKDEWEGKDVWYYLEQEYEPYAKDIFGNTPEMLSFYSQLLGYPYPWDKFHQVVVQDFVSGAMENTSAVIHGSFVQLTDRELLDLSHEDVMAHELFHHWFGDLVTCETWSQITLNEGFATYGEVLWQQHKYGEDEAFLHLRKDLRAYLDESEQFNTPLIRHRYNVADDVFDIHSYQKGGLVLHMLRREVGDNAFFQGLHHYLKQHAFKTVEVDDLRMAMEDVSGRDLRWFFDQWYASKGHPKVSCDYTLDRSAKILNLQLSQQQVDFDLFKLHAPLTIAYANGTVDTVSLWIDDAYESFDIALKDEVLWYALDPRGEILWELEEVKDSLSWVRQLSASGAYHLRTKALSMLFNAFPSEAENYATTLLDDAFWFVRLEALNSLSHGTLESDSALMRKRLTEIALGDPKSLVRSAALTVLDSFDLSNEHFFIQALHDSSYTVVRTCLSVLLERNPCLASEHISFLETEERGAIPLWVSRMYATCADPSHLSFFDSALQTMDGLNLFLVTNDFVGFADQLQNESVYDLLVQRIGQSALYRESWWARYAALQALQQVGTYYDTLIAELETEGESTIDQAERVAELRNKKANLSALFEEIQELQTDDDRPFRD